VDKKRDKLERKVLDSQERAFWDVHRPSVIHLWINHSYRVYPLTNLWIHINSQPGCVNTTEMDIKKVCRMNRPRHGSSDAGQSKDAVTSKEKSLNLEELSKQIKSLKYKLDRHSIKISKVAEL